MRSFPYSLALAGLLALSAVSCSRSSQQNAQDDSSTPPTEPRERKMPASIAVWQTLSKVSPSSPHPTEEIKKLLGKSIRVGGFTLVNEANGEEMTDFLLTPVAGGCIHVPPPPPNYMVHVTMAKGKRSKIFYGPVVVTGTLRIPKSKSDQKYFSYEMVAQNVQDFREAEKETQ